VAKHADYPFEVRPLTANEGSGYLVSYLDVAACISDGETVEEALANGRDVLRAFVALPLSMTPGTLQRASHAFGRRSYPTLTTQRQPGAASATISPPCLSPSAPSKTERSCWRVFPFRRARSSPCLPTMIGLRSSCLPILKPSFKPRSTRQTQKKVALARSFSRASGATADRGPPVRHQGSRSSRDRALGPMVVREPARCSRPCPSRHRGHALCPRSSSGPGPEGRDRPSHPSSPLSDGPDALLAVLSGQEQPCRGAVRMGRTP